MPATPSTVVGSIASWASPRKPLGQPARSSWTAPVAWARGQALEVQRRATPARRPRGPPACRAAGRSARAADRRARPRRRARAGASLRAVARVAGSCAIVASSVPPASRVADATTQNPLPPVAAARLPSSHCSRSSASADAGPRPAARVVAPVEARRIVRVALVEHAQVIGARVDLAERRASRAALRRGSIAPWRSTSTSSIVPLTSLEPAQPRRVEPLPVSWSCSITGAAPPSRITAAAGELAAEPRRAHLAGCRSCRRP